MDLHRNFQTLREVTGKLGQTRHRLRVSFVR
jgi:hypothetical protein